MDVDMDGESASLPHVIVYRALLEYLKYLR